MSTSSYIKQRTGGGFAFNIKIPRDVAHHYPTTTGRKRSHITIGLGTRDQASAASKAKALALRWKAEFTRLREQPESDPTSSDIIYAQSLSHYVDRGSKTSVDPAERLKELTREALDLQREFDRRGLESYDPVPPDLQARMDALEDARRALKGHALNHEDRYEPAFGKLGERWLREKDKRAVQQGKKTGASVHSAPAIRLFAGYVGPKTLRQVTREDVARYVEILKGFDRNWGRASNVQKMDFWDLKARFSLSDKPLSDRAVRHHLTTLAALWNWADGLGFCDSHNPFQGFLRSFRDKGRPTLAFTSDEIRSLFLPIPENRQLHEAMIVALYSGLRANELAALRWQDIVITADIACFSIKSGVHNIRLVPIHDTIAALMEKAAGKTSSDWVWPSFKGKGTILSRVFASHKKARSIQSGQKGFLSFRKTVGACLEKQRVSVDDWRDIMGLQPLAGPGGYRPQPGSLGDKKRLINKIGYPDLPLLFP